MCMALGLPIQIKNSITGAALAQERITEQTELKNQCDELGIDFAELKAFTQFKTKSINAWQESNPRLLLAILKGYAKAKNLPAEQFAALIKPDFHDMFASFGFINYRELNRFFGSKENSTNFHGIHQRTPTGFAVILLGALEIRKGGH